MGIKRETWVMLGTCLVVFALLMLFGTLNWTESRREQRTRFATELYNSPQGVRCFAMANTSRYVYETLSCVSAPDAGAR